MNSADDEGKTARETGKEREGKKNHMNNSSFSIHGPIWPKNHPHFFTKNSFPFFYQKFVPIFFWPKIRSHFFLTKNSFPFLTKNSSPFIGQNSFPFFGQKFIPIFLPRIRPHFLGKNSFPFFRQKFIPIFGNLTQTSSSSLFGMAMSCNWNISIESSSHLKLTYAQPCSSSFCGPLSACVTTTWLHLAILEAGSAWWFFRMDLLVALRVPLVGSEESNSPPLHSIIRCSSSLPTALKSPFTKKLMPSKSRRPYIISW